MLNDKDCAARGERRAREADGAVALVDGRRMHLVEEVEAEERIEAEEALASEACFAIMVESMFDAAAQGMQRCPVAGSPGSLTPISREGWRTAVDPRWWPRPH